MSLSGNVITVNERVKLWVFGLGQCYLELEPALRNLQNLNSVLQVRLISVKI